MQSIHAYHNVQLLITVPAGKLQNHLFFGHVITSRSALKFVAGKENCLYKLTQQHLKFLNRILAVNLVINRSHFGLTGINGYFASYHAVSQAWTELLLWRLHLYTLLVKFRPVVLFSKIELFIYGQKLSLFFVTGNQEIFLTRDMLLHKKACNKLCDFRSPARVLSICKMMI